MGLDQYVYFVAKQDAFPKDEVRVEDMYFRKNRHLQGYMDKLWQQKGHEDEFNCKDLVVDEEDILNIEKENLPDAYGFFWGERELEDDWTEIEKFKERALGAIKEGKTVIYTCWW